MNVARIPQPHASGGTRSFTRRDLVICASKLTGGATLALLSAQGLTRAVAAQDHVVTRTAASAEIGASPGAAYVRSAAASAAAERGAARVEAAAALASANSDNGAIAQSPVAVAFADPDQGAVAQSVISVASAASEDDTDRMAASRQAPAPAPANRGGAGRVRGGSGGGGRFRGAGGGGRLRAAAGGGRGRRVRERAGRGGGRDRVAGLPTAGSGFLQNSPLSSLLAATAAIAGIGAAALRERNEVAGAASIATPQAEQ
jgi:hypothetical protein